MKHLKLFLLFVIPMTSFAIDPDVIRFPASEYRQEIEYAKPAPSEDGEANLSYEEQELRKQAREERAPLQSPDGTQKAPVQSNYLPPAFEDPHHLRGTRAPQETVTTEQDMGRGLPSHAQPPRGLTPQEKSRHYGYPAD